MNISQRLPLLAFLLFLSACSSDGAPGFVPAPIIEDVNQISLATLTTQITVATANRDGNGFIVATDNSFNVLGSKFITGENNDVTINLTRPVIDSETITVTLFSDNNANGLFEHGTDMAVLSTGGGNIDTSSSLSVPASTADIRFHFEANGSSSWTILAEPSTYNWGTIAAGVNPALTVTASNLRVEVSNPDLLSHPFSLYNSVSMEELITQGNTIVSGTGTFYADSNVNVIESGNTIQFTITAALAAEITNYRCDVHTSTMIGTMTVM